LNGIIEQWLRHSFNSENETFNLIINYTKNLSFIVLAQKFTTSEAGYDYSVRATPVSASQIRVYSPSKVECAIRTIGY